MKRFLIFLFFLTALSKGYSQSDVHLYFGGGISMGDWASISDDMEEAWGMGYHARFLVGNDQSRFSFSPSYIFFPVGEYKFDMTYLSTTTEVVVKPKMHYINVEGRFSPVKTKTVDLYLHLGPSFLIYSESYTASNAYYEGSDNNSEFKTGAIAGAGCMVNLGTTFCLFADAGYSYISDDWDQVLISAGLMVRLF